MYIQSSKRADIPIIFINIAVVHWMQLRNKFLRARTQMSLWYGNSSHHIYLYTYEITFQSIWLARRKRKDDAACVSWMTATRAAAFNNTHNNREHQLHSNWEAPCVHFRRLQALLAKFLSSAMCTMCASASRPHIKLVLLISKHILMCVAIIDEGEVAARSVFNLSLVILRYGKNHKNNHYFSFSKTFLSLYKQSPQLLKGLLGL